NIWRYTTGSPDLCLVWCRLYKPWSCKQDDPKVKPMKIVLFYHSLLSDWNHGNAHVLRGVCSSLSKQGHQVTVYEPKGGWSLTSLLQDYGDKALDEFQLKFPHLNTNFYDPADCDLQVMLEGADMVI